MTGRTTIGASYLATLHLPLAAACRVADDVTVYAGAPAGGWMKGPEIAGEIVGPSGDWLRRMADGTAKLDVRLTVKADDGSFILVSYVGRSLWTQAAIRALEAGGTVGPDLLHIVIAPTFETGSPKYRWLNEVVAVGKAVSYREGEGAHITYDLFAVS